MNLDQFKLEIKWTFLNREKSFQLEQTLHHTGCIYIRQLRQRRLFLLRISTVGKTNANALMCISLMLNNITKKAFIYINAQ